MPTRHPCTPALCQSVSQSVSLSHLSSPDRDPGSALSIDRPLLIKISTQVPLPLPLGQFPAPRPAEAPAREARQVAQWPRGWRRAPGGRGTQCTHHATHEWHGSAARRASEGVRRRVQRGVKPRAALRPSSEVGLRDVTAYRACGRDWRHERATLPGGDTISVYYVEIVSPWDTVSLQQPCARDSTVPSLGAEAARTRGTGRAAQPRRRQRLRRSEERAVRPVLWGAGCWASCRRG